MLTWSFVAGYFEGEGSVGYYTGYSGRKKVFTLQVQLCNTNKWILEEIVKQLHVRGSVTLNRKKGGNHLRPVWRISVNSRRAIEFIRELLPHLPESSEKRPQIELALRIGTIATSWQAQRMKDMKRTIMGEGRLEESQIEKAQNILDFEVKDASN